MEHDFKALNHQKNLESALRSHLAPEVPAVSVQLQLWGVCEGLRVCVGSVCMMRLKGVCVWQWQGRVWSQRRFGSQWVLPAELLRCVGMQSAKQRRRCRRHSDRQVGGGQGQPLRGRVTQVHRLLVLR